jgi:hypothetical protein
VLHLPLQESPVISLTTGYKNLAIQSKISHSTDIMNHMLNMCLIIYNMNEKIMQHITRIHATFYVVNNEFKKKCGRKMLWHIQLSIPASAWSDKRKIMKSYSHDINQTQMSQSKISM